MVLDEFICASLTVRVLARIVHEWLLPSEQSAARASTRAFSGPRSGLALSGCESTLSKPATKILLCLQVLIHEFSEFVNYAG